MYPLQGLLELVLQALKQLLARGGFGFGVWGLRFGVLGLGFRAYGI